MNHVVYCKFIMLSHTYNWWLIICSHWCCNLRVLYGWMHWYTGVDAAVVADAMLMEYIETQKMDFGIVIFG